MAILEHPLIVLLISFVVMWVSAQIGDFTRARLLPLESRERDDFGVVQGATLTLLGLIIGFSFSMAISRYDQRKNYEEAEANAIGTEFVRVDLLPADQSSKARDLLRKYTDARVRFYEERDLQGLAKVNTETEQLQNELWGSVKAAAASQPNPVTALAVSGMNDVLNSQGYTQAAWWNRIPAAAWLLMFAIAICCNFLIGYGAHRTDRLLFVIVPLVVSISFFLICDIDSPRGGTIRVVPQNLITLARTLH